MNDKNKIPIGNIVAIDEIALHQRPVLHSKQPAKKLLYLFCPSLGKKKLLFLQIRFYRRI